MVLKHTYKYKIYPKITYKFLAFFPLNKIINFKRSKWKKLKTFLLSKKKKRLKFFDYSKSAKHVRFWEKTKKSYKNGLLLKNSIFKYFDNALDISFFKKQLKFKIPELLKLLVKPFYRLDILLWKLGVYCSVRKAQQKIRNKQILVNRKKINKIFFLKSGDIVQILDKEIFLKTSFLKKTFFFSLCEIDPYSNTFIILKNFQQLSFSELSTIFGESINLKNFVYYLSKK